MNHQLYLYNTLSRSKELFVPLHPPMVGMYVCGPTVYGDPHLGHARAAITFDLVFRYLMHAGYKVRYVRNITDVGHLEQDADSGEDKIAKKARLEQLEPMEVVQYYSDRYFQFMQRLNVLRPSIEPRASGHIIEQIGMIRKILEAGYAYEVGGSVYFDVEKYSKDFHYGRLSGRILEDMLSNTRELEGQEEKRNPVDFALWKKAQPEHIMRWPSPWSDGFPGWHLECSAMGTKYLGEEFDIHGGGMDLMFPHHECEIAQSRIANGRDGVRFWMHNNMITINGQKMGKSLGNFITLEEFFTGNHPNLTRSYDPMTIRFFILQAHYRSTLDFSNEALQAAEKGLKRLMAAYEALKGMVPARKAVGGSSMSRDGESPSPLTPLPGGEGRVSQGEKVRVLWRGCYEAMNDDFNSPVLIAQLFDAVRLINSVMDKKETLQTEELVSLKSLLDVFLFEVLGLSGEVTEAKEDVAGGLMELILSIRQKSRANKDWGTSDQIRDALQALNIVIRDGKEGSRWEFGDGG